MPRGDGQLGHDLDPLQPGPQDECGVFGVWARGEEVAKLTYFGLYALQHRGQEAAGIAVSDGTGVVVYKDLGLVAQVFDEATLASLRGHIAIGHTRYSTTGASNWENAQPTLRATPLGSNGRGPATTIALGHNGNLVNTAELAKQVAALQLADSDAPAATSDTALVTTLLASRPDLSVEAAALEVLPTPAGRVQLRLHGRGDPLRRPGRPWRAPAGARPLEAGWVIASETAALDIVGASVVREVEPGELIAIDEHGLRSTRFANPDPKGCLFEYVYLARPDTTISGRNVYAARVQIGRSLAQEQPVEADLVIPVPESGTPAAIGYAKESGIPYGSGFVKNSYVGRTFIQPSQTIRQLGIRLKLNPLREVIRGKRIVVVDDTIVRGNTQRAIVRMLREAGAIEVHVRISSPPVKWPCFYGIDFPTGPSCWPMGSTSRASDGPSAPTRSAMSRSTVSSPPRSSRGPGCAGRASTASTPSRCLPTTSSASMSWKGSSVGSRRVAIRVRAGTRWPARAARERCCARDIAQGLPCLSHGVHRTARGVP